MKLDLEKMSMKDFFKILVAVNIEYWRRFKKEVEGMSQTDITFRWKYAPNNRRKKR